jgi:AcrR family transcriptional regulator
MLKNQSKISTSVRRDQITDAVFHIASQKGMNGVTIAAIAQHVGVSEANLYRHFKNKNDILDKAIEKIGVGLNSNLEKVASSTDTPTTRLQRLFIGHLEFIFNNTGIPRIAFSDELHLNNQVMKNKLLKTIYSYAKGIEEIIKAGQKEGSIHKNVDPQALAMTFIGMIQVLILQWSLSDFSFDLVKKGTQLWKNFGRCITA